MTDERAAVVHDDEMTAIKDSRNRDMPLFATVAGEKPIWVVAASDHQAKLALVDRIYPLVKSTKRGRDDRYMDLLEKAITDSVSAIQGGLKKVAGSDGK